MFLKPHLKVLHNSDCLPSQPASLKHTNINCLVNSSHSFSRVEKKKKKAQFSPYQYRKHFLEINHYFDLQNWKG